MEGFEVVDVKFPDEMVKEHRNIMGAFVINKFLGKMFDILDS